MAPDPRRKEGGTIWAKAEQVSKDAKCVYGAAVGNLWLQGTTIECISKRYEDSSKRACNYIKAMYMVGNTAEYATIPLQSLKATNPAASAEAALLADAATPVDDAPEMEATTCEEEPTDDTPMSDEDTLPPFIEEPFSFYPTT
jgi:hypothetical protein